LFRFVFSVFLMAAIAAHAAPAESGQLDASPTLFAVMAAINAAGYDADLNSPNNHPIRMQIREELAKRNIPSLEAIKAYVAKHRLRNETAELGQYISFALSAGPPPTFAFRQKDIEIPPDAAALRDFVPLLAAFYKEANIEDLWNRSQRAIDQYLGRYHAPVTDAVLQVNLYLRQQTSGFRGRHFQIFVELQGAPNQIQTRSYGNEYTIVVTPSPDLRIFDIRHGYLHYSLDPLATRNAEILERKHGLIDHAQRALALDDSYKNDFLLLATESLIKAVEARLDKAPQRVGEALRQGFILTPFFSEQLPVYEKQEQAMILYYQEMVSSIELVKEDKRLTDFVFDRESAPSRTVQVAPPPPPPLTGAAKTLDEAEQLYSSKDYPKAKKLYLDVLQQTDRKPMQASAYYGLARIAALEKDPETSERLFLKVLDLEPEAPVKGWTLVYLGKLSLAAADGAQAGKYFQSALQVPGASDKAREEAQRGLQQSSKQ
jgi:tetratricopeptide (TPR) repeat protein